MLKVSHESPLCLLEESKDYNDFEYALAPSVIDNPVYADFYRNQSLSGRDVWLDTGVFEEGVPRSDAELIWCIDRIFATHIICPDILQDKDATIEGYHRFKEKLIGRDIKLVAVAQGQNEDSFLDCFEYFLDQPDVDTVCIPYDIHFYDRYLCSNSIKHVMARHMIVEMIAARYPYISKNVHLLGCADPIELMKYDKPGYDFLTSIDTSSPIMHGIHRQKYTINGLPGEKVKDLMVNHLEISLTPDQKECIMHNVHMFKYYFKGDED